MIAFDLLMANHELKIHHKLMTLDVEIVDKSHCTDEDHCEQQNYRPTDIGFIKRNLKRINYLRWFDNCTKMIKNNQVHLL